MGIEDPAPLAPLTYEQACALPVGSEVTCLDADVYGHDFRFRLKRGAVYKVYGSACGEKYLDFGECAFFLDQDDSHLFAASPSRSAPVADRGPDNCPQATAGESPAPTAPMVDDMRTLIIRLVHALKKGRPANELCGQAMDYLARHGMEASPLRTTTQQSPKQGG